MNNLVHLAQKYAQPRVSPELRQALLYTALFGASGAATSIFSEDEDDKKKWLSRALAGSVIGAGIGGLRGKLKSRDGIPAETTDPVESEKTEQDAEEPTKAATPPDIQEQPYAHMLEGSMSHPLTAATAAMRGANHLSHGAARLGHGARFAGTRMRNAAETLSTAQPRGEILDALNTRMRDRNTATALKGRRLAASRPKKRLTLAALASSYLADQALSANVPQSFKDNTGLY